MKRLRFYVLLLLVWLHGSAMAQMQDSTFVPYGVTVGINTSRAFDAIILYDKGSQLELTTRMNSGSPDWRYYVEVGYASLSEEAFLADYNLEQRSFYGKLGAEVVLNNTFFAGIAVGPTVVQERAWWFLPGEFFDDYIEERYNDTYINIVTKMQMGLQYELWRSVSLQMAGEINVRSVNNIPLGYYYYVPGFGVPFFGRDKVSIGYSIGLLIALY